MRLRPEQTRLLEQLSDVTLATLLRMARRIREGFVGEMRISARDGGVHYIEWVEVEHGNVIREELDL